MYLVFINVENSKPLSDKNSFFICYRFPGFNPASLGNSFGSFGGVIGSTIGNVLKGQGGGGGGGGGLPFNIPNLPFNIPSNITHHLPFNVPSNLPFNIPSMPFQIPTDIKGTYHYLSRILRGGQKGENPYHPATTVFNVSTVFIHVTEYYLPTNRFVSKFNVRV